MYACTGTGCMNRHNFAREWYTLKRREEGEADDAHRPSQHNKPNPSPDRSPTRHTPHCSEHTRGNTETKLAKLEDLLKLHQIRHITLRLQLSAHESGYCAELAVGDG